MPPFLFLSKLERIYILGTKAFMPKSHHTTAESLESFLRAEVPLARAAQICVEAYDGTTLRARAPLGPNINDKGTAFGGSLYNLCVTAGWGMTSLKCGEHGLQGDIVVAKAEIEYLNPLNEDLIAIVNSPNAEELSLFLANFRRRGKAAMTHQVTISSSDGIPCVRFKGKYAIVA